MDTQNTLINNLETETSFSHADGHRTNSNNCKFRLHIQGEKSLKNPWQKIKRNKTERSVNSSQVTHNHLITHISTMFSNPVRVHNYRSNGKKIKHSTAVSPCISIAILCLTFICKIFNKGYHMKWFKLSHQYNYIHLHKLILQAFLAQVPSFCFPQMNPCFNINV